MIRPRRPASAHRLGDGQPGAGGAEGARDVLAALVGAEDDAGHLRAAHRHRQRAVGQPGVVMFPRANPRIRRETVSSTLSRYSTPSPVGIAARHSDQRTTMRYDRASQPEPGSPPNYILAALMASGT